MAALAFAAALLFTAPAMAHETKRVPCWQNMKDGRMLVTARHARPGHYRILRYDMMKDHNISTSGSCLITTR